MMMKGNEMKYRTNELVEQLLIRGNSEYAMGFLCTLIEMLPSTAKLTAKQDKAMREAIEDCITGLKLKNGT